MLAASPGAPPGRVFYGWTVVTAAGLVLSMAYGTQYAFGVFFAALVEEFGWSRASLSGVFSLYAAVSSGFALVAGRLTDPCGPRTVIAIGGALLGAGLVAMSRVGALWQPYLLYGTIAALGMSTAYVPCNATVARWFTRRRGLAVGLASAGGSLGTLTLPPVAHFLVSRLGWRWSYVVFGLAIFLTLNALAVMMRRDPETVGLAPDGDGPARGPVRPGPPTDDWTISRALRSRQFWILYGVFTATWTPVFIPLVHLVPMARGLGVPPLLAATLVSAIGGAALIGRLVMGGASDRIGRRGALAIALALQGGGVRGVGAVAHPARALRELARVRLLLRGGLDPLPGHGGRRLRARAGGHPRGPPVPPRRLAGRARSGGRRLHLRPRGRLPAGLVGQRRLQRARAAAARLLPGPGRAPGGRSSGRLTPPAALAYSGAA